MRAKFIRHYARMDLSCILKSMKTRNISIIIILIFAVLLFSYETRNSTQPANPTNVDVDALRTEAVATYASSLTETMIVVPIVAPTLTIEFTPTLTNTTLTPETSTKADSCYNLIWIKDLTIPDGTQLKPNEVFTKTWLVQNNGGCAWPPGFSFNNVGGDLMRGKSIVLQEPIPVGAKREFTIILVAPNHQNELIQSSWRMADANGNYFGDTLWVKILVGNITSPSITNTP